MPRLRLSRNGNNMCFLLFFLVLPSFSQLSYHPMSWTVTVNHTACPFSLYDLLRTTLQHVIPGLGHVPKNEIQCHNYCGSKDNGLKSQTFKAQTPWNPWKAKSMYVYSINPMKCNINAACSSRGTEVISKIWRPSQQKSPNIFSLATSWLRT